MTRQMPQRLDAEVDVLATCLTSPQGFEQALELLRAEHFYAEGHATVFEAMMAAYDAGDPITVSSVCRELERAHKIDALRSPLVQFIPASTDPDEIGREYVRALAAQYASLAQLRYHAKLVKEAWAKRQIIRHFTLPMQDAWNGGTPSDVLSRVEHACMELHALVVDEGESKIVTGFAAAQAAQERVLGSSALREEGGVTPPFPFLDRLAPGALYVLGGYAKDGKTDVGVTAHRAACSAGHRVGVVSLEMPADEWTNRLIAQFGVPYGPLRKGVVSSTHEAAFKTAVGEIGLWDFQILDDPTADVADVSRFQKLGRFDLLVVDHLHRMNYEEAYNPRLALSAKVKSLAKLARTARVPIILLAQLHRPNATDGFPRPTMQSFKETGTIEQEATALWAIWRKRDKETGERLPASRFLVLADRYGEDMDRALHFDGNYQRFTETEWRDD